MISTYYSLDIIKRLMKELNITQSELASMIGKSRQTMSSLMTGRTPVKKYHLLAMTYVLDQYMDEHNIIFDKYRETLVFSEVTP